MEIGWLWLCCVLYGLLVLRWWAGYLMLNRSWGSDLQISPWTGPAPDDLPSLAVIIAAKDEADHIEPCVRAVADQGYPGLQMVVVNDRSADQTPAILAGLANQMPNLQVINITDRPEDWSGKTYALHRGSECVEAEYMLFLDADCRLRPGALIGGVHFARRHDADFLSIWPNPQLGSFWEQLLMPQAGVALANCFDSPGISNCNRRPPFANGQFILFRRSGYKRIGGHRSVRQYVIEDIPIARRARDHGLRVFTALGPQLLNVRMYQSLQQVFQGWSRIYVGSMQSGWRVALLAVSFLMTLMPFVLSPVLAGLLIARAGSPATVPHAILLAEALLHMGAVYTVTDRGLRMVGGKLRRLAWFPIGTIVMLAVTLDALFVTCGLKRLVWRDTAYRVVRGQLRALRQNA